MTSLAGKVALVTGGTRGIGRAIAERLVAAGASVAVCARGGRDLDRTATELGPQVRALSIDAADAAAVDDGVARVAAELGSIDVLINNVGGDGVVKPLEELSDDDWTADLDRNFLSATRFTRAALRGMRGRPGAILFIASIAGVEADPSYAPYCAAKAALIAYSKCVANAFAAERIRSNVILPGVVDTAQMARVERVLAGLEGSTPSAVRRRIEGRVPLGRYADPREVAELAVFLCSPAASYMTGGAFAIDGGLLRAAR
jgi:3-oxoacyl-[acyl-carrier protein] reductase